MPPVKPVNVLRFGSGQRNEPDRVMDHPADRLRAKRGSKRDNPVPQKTKIWKVKLPKLQFRCFPSEVTRSFKTAATKQQKPNANRTKTAVSHKGKAKGASTDCTPTDRDIFFFSPTTNAPNKKEKTKLSVLRTISKMLEENQLIRKRMVALYSAN